MTAHLLDGVYTDGSASPNPGPGGWAALRVQGGQLAVWRNGGESHSTNNRMELAAIVAGLHLYDPGEADAHTTQFAHKLYTDSSYAVQALTVWVHSWRRNGWRTKSGEVKNRDLLEQALDAMAQRPGVQLTWLKGHAGHVWNEQADRFANEGRLRQRC